MTERGLPISDGAPACPFVAFADDRDERATSPDHRHRCYAEAQPAPRALAHQEAYCLASAFPVCPTFQDWARREAARARESTAPAVSISRGAEPERTASPERMSSPERNPPRDWAAPPPWLSGEEGDPDEAGDEADVRPVSARRDGLVGSFADRVASGDEPPPARGAALPPTGPPSERRATAPPAAPPMAAASVAATPDLRSGGQDSPRSSRRRDGEGPEWESPRRLEEYPAIRARRLGDLSISPILIAFVALLLASAVLFALPGLFGFGGPGPGATPSPTAPPTTAAPSVAPTPVPEPTATVYIVQQGDTMSKIANKFGIPLQDLIDANAQNIPDPDRLQIGDEVIIPAAVPSELPGELPAES